MQLTNLPWQANGLMSVTDVLNLDFAESRPTDVIVLGRAGMDLYPQPDGCKIQDSLTFSSDLGGSAGNIAVALARAGINTSLLSAVSDDRVGDFVIKRLINEGIDTGLMTTTTGNERTSLALAEVRQNDCDVVIYRNNPADLKIIFNETVKLALTQTRNLVVTGTSLIDEQAKLQVLKIMDHAKASDCRIWLDLDYRSWNWPSLEITRNVYQQASKFADVIIGNEDEFSVLSDNLDEQINSCRDHNQIMILKRGAQGASLFADTARLDCGVYPVDALKPYGSGDAFLGNLMARYMQSKNWLEAMAAGSAAAAIVVSMRGCASAMPTSEQIETLQRRLTMSPAANWS